MTLATGKFQTLSAKGWKEVERRGGGEGMIEIGLME